MKDLAVICPTRGRPERYVRMMTSVLDTSEADILIRLDDDDPAAERVCPSTRDRVGVCIGPSVGRAMAINDCCEHWKDYRTYLLVADDVTFIRNGWDKEVLSAMDSFGDDIGVVHLSTGIPEGWVNWPCVSRKWLDAVGWFNPPRLKHYCQDTALQALGQALNRIRYVEPPVLVHDCIAEDSGAQKYKDDMDQFLWFMAKDFGPALDRLRAVMS